MSKAAGPIKESDQMLAILLDEYQRSSDYTHQMESQIEKIASIWIAFVLLAFAFGVKENVPPIFLSIPTLVSLVLLYTVCFFEIIVIAGGYSASLETRINASLGASALRWESEIAPQMTHLRVSLWTVWLVGLVGSHGIIVYSIYRTFEYYPKLVWVQIGLVCVTSPLIVWLFMRLPYLHKRAMLSAPKPLAKGEVVRS